MKKVILSFHCMSKTRNLNFLACSSVDRKSRLKIEI